MNHILMNRAAQAKAAIETARTPMQKRDARNAGLAVHADLSKALADESFKTAFLNEKSQSMIGVWKSEPVSDRPVFLVGPAGTRIVSAVVLPDGSRAEPNPQGQIVIPMRYLPDMIRRGFVRENSVITNLDTTPGA